MNDFDNPWMLASKLRGSAAAIDAMQEPSIGMATVCQVVGRTRVRPSLEQRWMAYASAAIVALVSEVEDLRREVEELKGKL
jgi:hypothetical protein